MISIAKSLFIVKLVVLGFLVDENTAVFNLTRNVSIQVEPLKYGEVNIYFVCPNIRSNEDKVMYYKVEKGIKGLIQKRKPHGIILKIKTKSDLGEYQCSIISKDSSTRNATLNIIDSKEMESPVKFVYDYSKTKYVIEKSGSVELDSEASTNDMVTWYRPPQFHIFTGRKLKIDNLNEFDFGTYYFAIGMTSKSVLQVTKVILLPQRPTKREKTIDEDVMYLENIIPKAKEIRYRPGNVAGISETVTWEQPPGTILLEHGRDAYFYSYTASKSDLPLYYRINKNGDFTVNKVGKVFISEWKNREVEMSVEGRAAYGAEMKVNCIPSPDLGNKTEVIWRLDDKIIHRGNTYFIKNFQKEVYGKYSCEIHRNGVMIQSRIINLTPKAGTESKIEMTPDPGLYYNFHPEKTKELHCEIVREDGEWKFRSKDIIWTFNGRKIDVENPLSAFGNINRFGRLDTRSVSILVLKDMGEDNQGVYKCFQGPLTFASILIMEQSEVIIELSPPRLTVLHNANHVAEFHCRIDTPGYNSSFIEWKFMKFNSTIEYDLPPESIVEKPHQTSATSFVTIKNSLKKHEGFYVCKVLGRQVTGILIVKTKQMLTVNPKEITVSPGGTARFLCQLTAMNGKVTWRRKDKKSFILNKENRLGGSTNSLLEIKEVTKADDGTIYECNFNSLTEIVTLWVKDECALNQRKCQNETCIDEGKFCDGKNDCGDNSDEDPKRCRECTPNSIHCDFLNNSSPIKRCVVRHWQCDGIDDCGNNFDELHCPDKNKDKCLGSHYSCDNGTLIPRAYWCDGDSDCKSMEDEEGCSPPQVIEPAKLSHLSVIENSTLTLVCQISGRPMPTITWRYNWGYLPDTMDHNVTEVVTNCTLITSTLTITNISPEDSGIYTCEGIEKRRIMAPDFSVTVTKGSVCKRPYFNNDAWDQEFCLRCYCSNVTDDCTSANGYITNPDLVESKVRSSDAAIMNYQTNEYFEPARMVSFVDDVSKTYSINTTNYEKFVTSDDLFLGGSFNMRGSWINRYGYPLTYKIIISGESVGHIPGPIVVIEGYNAKKIFYCSFKYRIPAYASNEYHENNIRIILWEQDRWFTDHECTKPVPRPVFIELLRDVRFIFFRIKYFRKQSDFKMSMITMQEAIKTKYDYLWVPRLEKCNCPSGYSGLSCETKTE